MMPGTFLRTAVTWGQYTYRYQIERCRPASLSIVNRGAAGIATVNRRLLAQVIVDVGQGGGASIPAQQPEHVRTAEPGPSKRPSYPNAPRVLPQHRPHANLGDPSVGLSQAY